MRYSFSFTYFPLLILISLGFTASEGIAQNEPILVAPLIRPSVHKTWILLFVIPHFSDACFIEMYSIFFLQNISENNLYSLLTLYTQSRTKSISHCLEGINTIAAYFFVIFNKISFGFAAKAIHGFNMIFTSQRIHSSQDRHFTAALQTY